MGYSGRPRVPTRGYVCLVRSEKSYCRSHTGAVEKVVTTGEKET